MLYTIIITNNMSENRMNVCQYQKKRMSQCDSNDSQWSEFNNPGNSHLDGLIKERNKFNLHFHKGEIIDIPEDNRMSLLPNQQNYNWFDQRKLLSIQTCFRRHPPRQRKTALRLQAQLSSKDPIILQIQKQWSSKTLEQLQQLRYKESVLLLQKANNYIIEQSSNRRFELKQRQQGRKRNCLSLQTNQQIKNQ